MHSSIICVCCTSHGASDETETLASAPAHSASAPRQLPSHPFGQSTPLRMETRMPGAAAVSRASRTTSVLSSRQSHCGSSVALLPSLPLLSPARMATVASESTREHGAMPFMFARFVGCGSNVSTSEVAARAKEAESNVGVWKPSVVEDGGCGGEFGGQVDGGDGDGGGWGEGVASDGGGCSCGDEGEGGGVGGGVSGRSGDEMSCEGYGEGVEGQGGGMGGAEGGGGGAVGDDGGVESRFGDDEGEGTGS
mmetsp:Transcript_11823/g.25335  ORF Transcript_11823/g.25335 Transcript_11823/m.25335 type:complete len:251 (-) Transcript_11823:272-1024(-)